MSDVVQNASVMELVVVVQSSVHETRRLLLWQAMRPMLWTSSQGHEVEAHTSTADQEERKSFADDAINKKM